MRGGLAARQVPGRVTRRGALAGAAGGAAWLAACAPGGGAAPAGSPEIKPAQLRMYEWSGQTDGDSARQIAEAYQQQQPKVQVSVEQPPAGGEPHYEQLLALFVAGGAPDVINTQSWRWHEFAAKNLLLSLDKLRARDRFDVAWPRAWEKMYDREGDAQYYGFQSVRIYTRWFGWWRNEGQAEWDPLVEPRKAHWAHPTIMDRLSFLMYDAFHTLRISPTLQEQGQAVTIEQGRAAMWCRCPRARAAGG